MLHPTTNKQKNEFKHRLDPKTSRKNDSSKARKTDALKNSFSRSEKDFKVNLAPNKNIFRLEMLLAFHLKSKKENTKHNQIVSLKYIHETILAIFFHFTDQFLWCL